MDMKQFMGSRFLKLDDVRRKPIRAVITDVQEGKYQKPDLVFEDGSKLGANATNVCTLVRAFGGASEDWIGKEVELHVGTIEYKGENNDAILVRPISTTIEENGIAGKRGDMDDEVPF